VWRAGDGFIRLPLRARYQRVRSPAIVTVRRRLSNRFGEEEPNRRADLADAMMQDFKRQIAAKLRADGPSPTQKRQ
jgi:hypothetical protein